MQTSPLPPLISVVILARDSAETIARTLESVSNFDEVIVYDNGSSDNTATISEKFSNVRVVHGHFDGFANTRNRADRLARNDWVFKIDSDEWLSPELNSQLRSASLSDSTVVYTFYLHNFIFGKRQRSRLGKQMMERLYNRTFMHWVGGVHERICAQDGSQLRTRHLSGLMWHDSYRSVGHLFQKRWYYAQPHLRDSLKPLHPGLASLRALWRFLRCYVLQMGFIDGWRGFVLSIAEAYGTFLKYTWAYHERQRRAVDPDIKK